MKNKIFLSVTLLILLSFSFSSCFKDLDLEPPFGLNSASVYEDPNNYIHVLAKLYSGLALTGNQGPAGNPDILGIDEGFSGYIRVLWNMQELCTDEVKCAWNDPGIPELNKMTWSATNSFVTAMYYRIFFQIPLCNEFIRESSDEKMNERGFSAGDQDNIKGYRAEAQFLRALSYYHAMDLFGNVPFITEEDLVGAFFPEQISRADLFDYVEDELLAVEALLPAPQANEYARADKAAAWTLLARLYLNAEVYTGTNRYADCATWCSKIIAEGGYTLEPDYTHLFMADNHNSNEVIFPVAYDGLFTQTFGGTTFLTHASIGGDSMSAIDLSYFGVEFGWGGNRATPEFASIFPDTVDGRNLFFTFGQTLTFSDDAQLGVFTVGYPVAKWRNITSTGEPGSDATGNYVDTDFPMFRLADVYLMYAECAARGFGDGGLGVNYVNLLRERAYGDASHNVAGLTPEEVLDERARELYWEGYRRTDLIRYGLFTGDYAWAFKGGTYAGTTGLSAHLNLFPLPSSDIIANPNLDQNTGY
ncbi:MAG: RagB/SusD family nutrient uptake outer membrane protein [Chitinophagales bacterium]|nr:RagB/SusD family nutrient uptake outer membrane protein [Chitinophagales bacterium]